MRKSSHLEGESFVRHRLREAVVGETSILDVGCGPGKYLNKLNVPVRVGIDAHGPYLDCLNAQSIHGRAEDVLPTLADRSFGTVIALDFIEHLEKPAALRVIAAMQRIARNQVLVFTPMGFQENRSKFSGVEQELQTHRSGWKSDDLGALGFSVEKWPDFDNGALWAVWAR